MPRDIPIKYKWSEQYLLTEDAEWQRRECVLMSPFHSGMALHVSCCWVSNSSVDPGEQQLVASVWTWLRELGKAQLSVAAAMGTGKAESGTGREMGLEHKRLLLIICLGNIVWFSSVCSHSMCRFSALGNFCENLLMVYKLGERHGGFLFACVFGLLCFFPFNAWVSLAVISFSVPLFFLYILRSFKVSVWLLCAGGLPK